MRNAHSSLFLLLAGLLTTVAHAAVPAFPGAEGWGAETPGGRGGRTIVVDTLADTVADDGVTSLREALLETGPRTVVFAVAGVLELERPLFLGESSDGTLYRSFDENPHGRVTIAGQSAPGGGVTISGYPFIIGNYVSDVVVRFLRFRNAIRDAEGLNGPVSLGDGLDFQHARRVVIDHCSVAWATDEGISLERVDNVDITIQSSLVAETLLYGGHESGPHSRALNVAYGADRISIHHNLFLSNNRRSPHLVGDRFAEVIQHPTFDVRNNLIYNYGERAIHFGIGAQANVVANLLLAGPDTPPSLPLRMEDADCGTRIYLQDNEAYLPDGTPQGDGSQIGLVRFPEWRPAGLAEIPFEAPSVTTYPVTLLPRLITTLGALPHDSIDLRVLQELAAGTGSVGGPVECQNHACPTPAPASGTARSDADLDGMPDIWELRRGLDAFDPADAAVDGDGDGYTHLEEYLHALAMARQVRSTQPRLTAGPDDRTPQTPPGRSTAPRPTVPPQTPPGPSTAPRPTVPPQTPPGPSTAPRPTVPPQTPPGPSTEPRPTVPPQTPPGPSTEPRPTVPPQTPPGPSTEPRPTVPPQTPPGPSTEPRPTVPPQTPPGPSTEPRPTVPPQTPPGPSTAPRPTVPPQPAPPQDLPGPSTEPRPTVPPQAPPGPSTDPRPTVPPQAPPGPSTAPRPTVPPQPVPPQDLPGPSTEPRPTTEAR